MITNVDLLRKESKPSVINREPRYVLMAAETGLTCLTQICVGTRVKGEFPCYALARDCPLVINQREIARTSSSLPLDFGIQSVKPWARQACRSPGRSWWV